MDNKLEKRINRLRGAILHLDALDAWLSELSYSLNEVANVLENELEELFEERGKDDGK